VLSSVAPPASTASRPAFVTIASAPLSGRDGERYTTDLRLLKIRIFLQKGLDSLFRRQPVGQISWLFDENSP
jgi:hypothetical protein